MKNGIMLVSNKINTVTSANRNLKDYSVSIKLIAMCPKEILQNAVLCLLMDWSAEVLMHTIF